MAKPPTIAYQCQDCRKPFRAVQGSRRKFCTRCANKRQIAGRRAGGMRVKA